ncbi:MAG: DNA primase [Candidatus Harrisonbacteria bacterium CG10_big_fil_rev_8_21_14_0_10_42_17]|uniref:DNA primase n=1 Tax=Candidatus Harrisonbacteria bacterium CG10_big_fil_rev_8_21_14_0_10_42_17 TaxID=1974584 RepID=A0A2M6WIN7_9BACT|nr:MAG: DNA primase [Candidatus Harrisonbacteria bacterium CG10_big_fil_rev_8_21_14_0_10_42_17]
MSDTPQLIKEKLDIAEFIRQYVALSPAGKNLKGLCPFHKEKTPSFIVSPDRGTWHCFGCGEHGDIFEFLMKYENLEFFEALKVLAEKAGVELKLVANPDQRKMAVLYEINEHAKEFYKAVLRSDKEPAKVAMQYLTSRGLKPETIDEFELGFAPNVSDGVSQFLSKRGFRIADIERAGFVFKTERGTYWDRFRNRIMFPLYNSFGKTVGFTGRIMPGAETTVSGAVLPKYTNSPETPIFNKSKVLFGFHLAKGDIREQKTAVLVEGQMDVIAARQDGIRNVFATSGTAVTQDHIRLIKRFTEKLVVFFDTDDAGQMATEKVIDLASQQDVTAHIIRQADVPEGLMDPADIAQAQPGTLATLVANAQPAMEWYFERYANKGGDISLFKTNVRAVLSKIKQLSSAIERSHWVLVLSRRTGIGERDLLEEMNALHDQQSPPQSSSKVAVPTIPQQPLTRHDLISERVLSLALAHDTFHERCQELEDHFPESYRPILSSLLAGSLSLGTEIETIPKPVLDRIVLQSSLDHGDASDEDVHKEFTNLLRELRRMHLHNRREQLRDSIRVAEEHSDEKALLEALQAFDTISKDINNV